ncbi:esterase/lipase family protein [Nocardioides antri]|uniref:DUF676 domain-containing protein n=1 Tax=Nocardioides antri TaxID=2607659 RepID=A0A5B1M8K7_9ACTN|nr:hypothetical protein [Nocardioides antri]KAA1428868.1 hypothetical protein F0U47_01225 [Nocardioides antri]
MRTSRRRPAAGAVALLLLFSLLSLSDQLSPSRSTAAAAAASRAPVMLVHGYNNRPGGCQGINLDTYWGNATTQLTSRAGVAPADVIPVSYYSCDRGGVDITGSGPGTNYPVTKTSGIQKLRAGHSSDTPITRIAQDLAWFIHNQFTRKGRPVRAVGHSMGGLVIREALRRVQAGDPRFPGKIDVPVVLTISTPHKGWADTSCKETTQCAEMTPGSRFLANLQKNRAPQGVRGTKWWAMATRGELISGLSTVPCDAIPTGSATAVAGVRVVYTDPCYRHSAYLHDDSQKRDAQGSTALGGRHSLAFMVYVLR